MGRAGLHTFASVCSHSASEGLKGVSPTGYTSLFFKWTGEEDIGKIVLFFLLHVNSTFFFLTKAVGTRDGNRKDS